MNIFQDFEYKILTVTGENADNLQRTIISLGKYQGNETTVVIPDEIEGYPVTEIGSTFSGMKELESVTLPKSWKPLVLLPFKAVPD